VQVGVWLQTHGVWLHSWLHSPTFVRVRQWSPQERDQQEHDRRSPLNCKSQTSQANSGRRCQAPFTASRMNVVTVCGWVMSER
jgi:hypothetical protein